MTTSEILPKKSWLRELHEDEGGLETIQVVMILGVAAVALIVLWNFFPGIRKWAKRVLERITGAGGDSGGIDATPDTSTP